MINVFFNANRLEKVWCGGNLLSELKSEIQKIKNFYWYFPYKEITNAPHNLPRRISLHSFIGFWREFFLAETSKCVLHAAAKTLVLILRMKRGI